MTLVVHAGLDADQVVTMSNPRQGFSHVQPLCEIASEI